MSDKTGLPPMSQQAKLALAGLDDEEVLYQLALVALLTFNQFAKVAPERVSAFAVQTLTHALCETGFNRDPGGEPVKRKITAGMKTMPMSVKLEMAGLDDEGVIKSATESMVTVMTHPETPHVTLGYAASVITNSLLELGFHR